MEPSCKKRAWHRSCMMDDLVEHVIALPGRELAVLAPRDREALLSEEAFEQEEFLPYWAELWPSGVALARAIARRPLTGRRALELGCGLGLPALAAALQGGRVLATDWAPDAIALLERNAARNDVDLTTATYRWDDATRAARRRPGRSCSPPTCSTRRATCRSCSRCCRA